LKRNGFRASPADYRRGNRPTIGLSEIGSVAQIRGAARAATRRTGKLELRDPRGAGRVDAGPTLPGVPA